MADYYLGALKELERRSRDNVLIFSDVLTERLNTLVETMIGNPLSDNDYLKTLQLFYTKYRRFDNKPGMLFCLLRMEEIDAVRKKKNRKHIFPNLEFSPSLDPETAEFLQGRGRRLGKAREEFYKVALLISLVLTVVFLAVSVLLLHIPFFAGWIGSIVVYGVSLYICMVHIYPGRQEKRITGLYGALDPLCVSLDRFVKEKAEA